MKKILILALIVLLLSACKKSENAPAEKKTPAHIEKKVPCSACNGKGQETYNYNERIAIASVQLYFAGHARKCEICQKYMKDETLPICKEAEEKMNAIMEKAKNKPPKMITEKCWACGGSGILIEMQ